MAGGGSGSGKGEKGKGPEDIWPEYGQGNENHIKKKKSLAEEDVELCDQLALFWDGRIPTGEMTKYPPPPPGIFTDGRSARVQSAAAAYWLNMNEGSILRRWIALLLLEGKVGQTSFLYNEKLIEKYAEIIMTEVHDFDFEQFHSYMLEAVKILPKKPSEGSTSKTKNKKKK